jgi:phage N-6-adenine-methyltransferase
MSLVGFKAKNHPQQVGASGAKDAVDDRGTDPALFKELSERFHGFTLDVAASDVNAKCERFYTKAVDGLAQSWAGERVWCNPPYSNIGPWVQKAHKEAERAAIIVMLLPANRTEQGWWQDYVEPFRDQPDGPVNVQFLRGRPRFVRAGAESIGPNERPPLGCCLVVWERDVTSGIIGKGAIDVER